MVNDSTHQETRRYPRSHVLGFASVGASIAIWNAKKGEDNAHAERFGIFVGLWAPTFFAIANGLASERSAGTQS